MVVSKKMRNFAPVFRPNKSKRVVDNLSTLGPCAPIRPPLGLAWGSLFSIY